MNMNNFQWTRQPKSYQIGEDRVEIVTAPHTDLWQRTYYHFRNDNAPVLQMETEEQFFSFVVKTDFAESHHRFDQCGIVMYLDSDNWLKGSIEYENEKFQHLGSWVVRVASGTDIPDAPSGFRAYSREAALRLNVVNEYTYTLETIIQAGHEKLAMTSVPIRTNGETRPSRLFSSMWRYMKRSSTVIIRSFLMYKPLRFFSMLGGIMLFFGVVLGARFLYFFLTGSGGGHTQSLILAAVLMLAGFQSIVVGLLGDVIAANRKILQDVQYRVRKLECSQDEQHK